MAELVGLALAGACLLFVLSLPLGKGETGTALRRWAGVLFVVALAPALVSGIAGFGRSPGTSGGVGVLDILALVGGLGLAGLAAWGALEIRARLGRGKRDAMSDYFSQRSTGKRPVERDDDPRNGPFEG